MAMTFNDVEDLIRLLDEHPRLKSELRLRLFEEEWAPFMKYVREILASSLASIEELKRRAEAHDQRLAELAADQASFRAEVGQQFVEVGQRFDRFEADVDQRFDKVDQRFDKADQRFDKADERFEQVDQRFEQVDQRFDKVDQRFDKVDQRFDKVDQRFEQVDQRLVAIDQRFDGVDRQLVNLNIHVDDLRGKSLERDFRDKVHAFVGTFLLGTRIVLPDQLPGLYEAYESGDLSDEDYRRVVATDAVVRGRKKGSKDSVYVAVEVSTTIDERDVERAKRTADILTGLGLETDAMVFGNKIREEAQAIANSASVLVHLQA